MWQKARQIVCVAIGLASPSFSALVVLFLLGFLAPIPGLVALGSILALTALIVAPFAIAMSALQKAFGALEADASAPIGTLLRVPPGPNPAGTLWRSLTRQTRIWRDRVAAAEAQVAGVESAITALPDPVILIDRHRRIVRANAAWAGFIGAVAEPRDLASALRNPALLAAADAVLAGEHVRTVEFAVSVPVARLLEARLARIDGPSLDGAAAVITLHDITALKRADEMRADFVANAGHELKTPLSTLLGFIETLRGPARDDAAARERFLGIMHEQAGRMARLVDDLLSLSRIELNEHVAPTARVALGPILDSIAATLELRAAERGMRIELSLPDDLPDVQGERDELAQVFQNLLDNAVKYARRDSTVTVTAGAGDRALPAMVWVAVADHGEGIPNEHLPRLTERFYRIDNARSRELGGTGLGLAIVKHVLNRHRGRLEIASTLGQGSTFMIWLRAAPAESPLRPQGGSALE